MISIKIRGTDEGEWVFVRMVDMPRKNDLITINGGTKLWRIVSVVWEATTTTQPMIAQQEVGVYLEVLPA